MSAPSRFAVVLALVTGAFILGACIPLSEILLTRALEQGGFLSSLVLLVMLAGSGLCLLVWAWHMNRKRQNRL